MSSFTSNTTGNAQQIMMKIHVHAGMLDWGPSAYCHPLEGMLLGINVVATGVLWEAQRVSANLVLQLYWDHWEIISLCFFIFGHPWVVAALL